MPGLYEGFRAMEGQKQRNTLKVFFKKILNKLYNQLQKIHYICIDFHYDPIAYTNKTRRQSKLKKALNEIKIYTTFAPHLADPKF